LQFGPSQKALIVSLLLLLGQQSLVEGSLSVLFDWDQIANWSGNMIILIADAAIAWRAWVVWMDSRSIKWTLTLLMLADTGIGIYDAFADTQAQLSVSASQPAVTFDWVFFASSLSVNTLGTLLIAYKAWRYHKSIKAMANKRQKTHAQRILLLFVESGAFLAIFQIISLILTNLDLTVQPLSPVDFATCCISELYTYIAAFSSATIFILVQTNNTYEQRFNHDMTSQGHESLPQVSNIASIAGGTLNQEPAQS